MTSKVCSACKMNVPIGDFFKNKASKDGYSNQCKICQNKSNAESYARHRAARLIAYRTYDRSVKLFSKYKITPEEWDKLYVEQKGRCFICGRHQSKEGKRLAVDHDHHTGEIRGLLCMSCNTKLGWMEKHFDNIIKHLGGEV